MTTYRITHDAISPTADVMTEGALREYLNWYRRNEGWPPTDLDVREDGIYADVGDGLGVVLIATRQDIYSQPAAAMDHGEDQPAGTTYVSEADVAAYVAAHAPDVDPTEVERALTDGWREGDTVADAIDRAIATARERA